MENVHIQNFLRVFRASFLNKGLVQKNIIELRLELKKVMTFNLPSSLARASRICRDRRAAQLLLLKKNRP